MKTPAIRVLRERFQIAARRACLKADEAADSPAIKAAHDAHRAKVEAAVRKLLVKDAVRNLSLRLYDNSVRIDTTTQFDNEARVLIRKLNEQRPRFTDRQPVNVTCASLDIDVRVYKCDEAVFRAAADKIDEAFLNDDAKALAEIIATL